MKSLARLITKIIDMFYVPQIRKHISPQVFRYAACGGMNVMFGWVVFFVTYNFVIQKRFFDLGFMVMSPHTASWIVTFVVQTASGFYLNKYVAFKNSPLRNRTQMVRYAISTLGSLLLDYLFLKVFVEVLHIYPTPSKMLATLFVTAYSFMMQKFFTFRGASRD